MSSKCEDWVIELYLVTSCSRDRSCEWVIPTWICPALLSPSPCWIWVRSPAALFASPRFSPAASDAPSAGVSGRARGDDFTTNPYMWNVNWFFSTSPTVQMVWLILILNLNQCSKIWYFWLSAQRLKTDLTQSQCSLLSDVASWCTESFI